ncbi:MAG: hypothetical protein RLZZ422_1422 [Pseudomonadota bacterium]|jgi:hypothetical protein
MSQEQQQLYDLVVTGHSSDLKVAELVQKLMTVLGKKSSQLEFKLSEALIFEQNSNTALDGVDLETAEHYQQEFNKLQVHSEVRPTIQLVSISDDDGPPKMYKCPACGHEQPKVKGRLDMCDVCGVIGERYSNSSRLKTVMEEERRRIAQEQAQKVRESLAKAEYQERLKLRRMALKGLGVKDGKQWQIWLVAALGVVLIGGGTYWGMAHFGKPEESTSVVDKGTNGDTKALTINPQLLQGIANNNNGKVSLTDQAVALMDHGLLPDAPAVTIANPEQLAAANGSNNAQGQSTVSPTGFINPHSPEALSSPLMKSHKGRGYEVLMKLEEANLTYARFKRPTAQHLVDQDYLAQLIGQSQWSMGMVFIDTLTDAYEQGALYVYSLLSMPNKQNSAANAQTISEKLTKAMQALPEKDEQRLLLQGALGVVEANTTSSPTLVIDSAHFKQVLAQIPNTPTDDRVALLIRLANEQYLFDQRFGAQQFLQLAEKELEHLSPAVRELMSARIAASYFIIEDEASMLRLSDQIHDAQIRERLFKGLDEVRTLVKTL